MGSEWDKEHKVFKKIQRKMCNSLRRAGVKVEEVTSGLNLGLMFNKFHFHNEEMAVKLTKH